MDHTTTKRSSEQRKAQAEALQASIIDQVQQLADSRQWRTFLEFARSFHDYSLNNLLLILAQHPEATMVAGFRQWQAKGRQVRKGETSIKIFGYSTKTAKRTDEDNLIDEEERTVHYFPVLSVFDISQTDPIEGATQAAENPVRQLTGDDDHGVLHPLSAHLEDTGWTITHETLTHAKGYTDPARNTVVLHRNLASEQAAKTLIHEAAHIQLGHIDNLQQYRHHRGRMEVEAESVAYIVAGLAGFDTSAYSIGYITGWAKENLDLIRETAARVLTATRAIADVITP